MNFLQKLAGIILLPALLLISCSEAEKLPDTLSVSPNKALTFRAAGNKAIVLTVETNAAEYNVTPPSWVKAEINEKTVTVTVDDNDAEPRSGFITFTAGTARPVQIPVSQTSKSDIVSPETNQIVASLTDASGKTNIDYVINTEKFTSNVVLKLEKASEVDAYAEIFVDEQYLTERKYLDGVDYKLLPGVTLTNAGITVPSGKLSSENFTITSETGGWELIHGESYLLPICIKWHSENISTAKTDRVNYIIKKKAPKEIKNIVFFETNDANPLNAMEYVLEDGTPFFDAVVLFSANINYNQENDLVYLHKNPGITTLLEEKATYLQPLREKGIKVYLGLLGNWDAAGLCQLSDWGAKMWAEEVANAVKDYQLDGVMLDDEYSRPPLPNNKWFASEPSPEQGSRLCYELKKALKKACPWPTGVSVYIRNNLGTIKPVTDLETKETFRPGDFVDFWVPNYGGKAYPLDGMTLQNCAADSFELARKIGDISVATAKKYVEEGYGWCMWYAFNPVPGHPTENFERSFGMFNRAAEGFYGQKLVNPTGYYKAPDGGNGIYDPTRYNF